MPQPNTNDSKISKTEPVIKKQNLYLILGILALVGIAAAILIARTFKSSVSRSAGSGPAPSLMPVARLEVTPPIPSGANDIFEDVTTGAGITFVHQFCDTRIANIIESNGSGGTWLDFDGDGLVDFYLVNAGPLEGVTHHKPGTVRQPNALYRNKGNGTFEEVTAKAGVAGAGYGTAAVAGDFDNDGRPDIYMVAVGRSMLYRNKGNGTFEDVTEKAGVGNIGGTGIGAVWLDVDADGHLDLFVANYLTFDPKYQLFFSADAYPGPLAYKPELNRLYRNKGNGTFEDVSESSGIQVPGHRAMSAAVLDYNQDGAPDLYISNDGTPNLLMVNDGKGHFKDIGPQAQVAFNAMGEAAGSMAATIGDCNGDGQDDILVTRLGYGSLYMGNKKGVYDDRMQASNLGSLTAQFVGWGGCFLDFNNDTALDIFIANGDAHYLVGWESLLLENKGEGSYTDAAEKGGAYFNSKVRARGSAVADYDNDGRMDVLVSAMGDRCFLLHNRDKSGNNWLTVDLEGIKSNRDGFGSLITLQAGGKTLFAESRCAFGFLMQGDRRVHFGLGKANTIDRIQIRWPSRQVQELTDIKANQILKIREPGDRK